ncbi:MULTISPECIES: ClpP-like prohead protease/major capsid protein fusion protein [Edwardsiella]|uniref:ClpP-like prohead protease/major capsid protein fusion protein n=1 Tax=Edwardsiella TaxID=635 RepID=UPI00351C534D
MTVTTRHPPRNSCAPAGVKGWFSICATAPRTAEIRIYDEIGLWGISARQFADGLTALGEVDRIDLHIHSPGGDVFDGIAIYNLLSHHPASKTVYIDGLAASMASVIAMVGDPIIMPENAMMMLHKPWGIAGGDADDIRDYADLLDKLETVLIPAYMQKSGQSREAIAALLEQETWLSGAECVEQGFADTLAAPLQRMAALQSQRLEEFAHMPKTIRNMVSPPRNSGEMPTPTTAPDEVQIRAQEREAQRQRVNAIRELFALFGEQQTELMMLCIGDVDCGIEQAKDRLLAALGQNASASNVLEAPQNRPGGHVGNGNITGDAIRQALLVRAGFEESQRDNPYNGMTLREMSRCSLTDRGVGIAGLNPMQMVGLSFTHSTSDFGNILLDVAHKSILQGWEEAPETFEQWTRKGSLSDFKVAHRVGLGGFPSLRQVREGAEFKYVTLDDHQATIALATFGELFSVTRQAIINDDLHMLTDVPMKLGRAAKATIADLVYAILLNNPKLSADGIVLFDSAKHGNILSGAAMDVASLDKARQLMRRQKEGQRHLNIRPAFVLVPTALEASANQVIRSASVKGAEVNAGVINPIQNFASVIAEPRLDDSSVTTYYLAAAKGSDTIEVAYLNGVDVPYIDQQEGFEVDGITSKVRIDAGVSPIDHRGLVRCDA